MSPARRSHAGDVVLPGAGRLSRWASDSGCDRQYPVVRSHGKVATISAPRPSHDTSSSRPASESNSPSGGSERRASWQAGSLGWGRAVIGRGGEHDCPHRGDGLVRCGGPAVHSLADHQRDHAHQVRPSVSGARPARGVRSSHAGGCSCAIDGRRAGCRSPQPCSALPGSPRTALWGLGTWLWSRRRGDGAARRLPLLGDALLVGTDSRLHSLHFCVVCKVWMRRLLRKTVGESARSGRPAPLS